MQSAVAEAEHERARLGELARSDASARAALLAAEVRSRQAAQGHAGAVARIRTLQLEEDYTDSAGFIVRAPLDGVVIESWARPGTVLQANQSVMYVADNSDGVFVEVEVPALKIHKLEVGTPANIAIDRQETVNARIDRISDIVDRTHEVDTPDDLRSLLARLLPDEGRAFG